MANTEATRDELIAANAAQVAALKAKLLRWGAIEDADTQLRLAFEEIARLRVECDEGRCPSAQHERLAAKRERDALTAQVAALRRLMERDSSCLRVEPGVLEHHLPQSGLSRAEWEERRAALALTPEAALATELAALLASARAEGFAAACDALEQGGYPQQADHLRSLVDDDRAVAGANQGEG